MKFAVRPMLTVTNGSDVDAALNVKFNHNDNEVNVRARDSMFKDGLSVNGLSVGVRNDRFDCVYDCNDNDARIKVNTHCDVRDKCVRLTYRNALRANAQSVEAAVDVDDSNTAGLIMDLSNWNGFNHRNCTLKWTYRNGDYSVTPSYNLGTESLHVKGAYTVDSENSLEASYDMNNNMGSLQWVNSSGAGGGGDLRITARANLADADSAKQMPTLLIEKTWDMDV